MRTCWMVVLLIALIFSPAVFAAGGLVPLTGDDAALLASRVEPPLIFNVYAGQNDALKAAAVESPRIQVATGFAVDLDANDLFSQAVPLKSGSTYAAMLTSVDAQAVRLLVDLSALNPGDEIWLIDPFELAVFGPYTYRDHMPGGRWLPTIPGDTVMVVGRSLSGERPPVRVDGLSHFFWDWPAPKASLNCNVNVACEADALDIATGVGFLVIPEGTYDQGLCSGCLIDSTEKGPYFLTANHCIPGATNVWNVEVVWDYRINSCAGTIPPAISLLPRSSGNAVLMSNYNLDGSLLLLDSIPGTRTYVPWDLRDPVVDEPIIGIHHPVGGGAMSSCHMRVSRGEVLAIDQSPTIVPFQHETKVHWDEGVTEGGSSGSCLLFQDNEGHYRLTGMLSGGPQHVCTGDRQGNYDYYASFRHFYPLVEGYLSGNPPAMPQNVTASQGTHASFVRISWNAVAGATSYLVYRSAANDISENMTLLADTVTGSSYDDHTASSGGVSCLGMGGGEKYYYWVRARNADGDSGFSQPDRGYAGKGAAESLNASADMTLLLITVAVLALSGRRQRG